MSVKPIDMQVLLPKLHKNELLKPRIIHKVENEQQVMQNTAQQDVDQKLRKVNTFDQKDVNKIKDEKEQSSKEKDGQSAKKDQEKEDEKDDSKNKSKSTYRHIDIKV